MWARGWNEFLGGLIIEKRTDVYNYISSTSFRYLKPLSTTLDKSLIEIHHKYYKTPVNKKNQTVHYNYHTYWSYTQQHRTKTTIKPPPASLQLKSIVDPIHIPSLSTHTYIPIRFFRYRTPYNTNPLALLGKHCYATRREHTQPIINDDASSLRNDSATEKKKKQRGSHTQ